MQENGVVIAIDGHRATIRLQRGEKCNGCTACNGFGDGSVRLIADNPIGAQIGDPVTVVVQAKQVVGHSLLLFIFPIVAMIGGYAAGQYLLSHAASSEGPGIIGALIGLLLSAAVLKAIDLRRAADPLAAQITSVQAPDYAPPRTCPN